MTSKLCSITSTVSPFQQDAARLLVDVQYHVHVSQSLAHLKYKTYLPVERRCNSEANFTRCASPPDNVVAG